MADGGVSPYAGGVRSTIQLGAGMPGLSVSGPLARGIPLSALQRRQGLAARFGLVAMCELRPPSLGDGRDDLPGYAHPAHALVSGDVVGDHAEERRRAMVRPGRDRLAGAIEVDETYLGGIEKGMRGRQTEKKALIAVAAQEEGHGIGRIRMRRIADASAASLMPFVRDSIEPGSVVHTDAWLGYEPLEKEGYRHRITFLRGHQKSPSDLLPRVHRVISLLKRWLLGTHQGAVSFEHLDYYLDEFTFRFNRRRSRSRGKLFFRLVQQAVAVEPATYASMVQTARPNRKI